MVRHKARGDPDDQQYAFASHLDGVGVPQLVRREAAPHRRWQVLHRHGSDVGRDGLHGAPRVRVLAGAERHATVDRALRLLGLGESALGEVPATPAGAMDREALAGALASGPAGPTIVCAQSGNVCATVRHGRPAIRFWPLGLLSR